MGACVPALRLQPPRLRTDNLPLRSWQYHFSKLVFQCHIVQKGIYEHRVELGVLIVDAAPSLGLKRVHATKFGFPLSIPATLTTCMLQNLETEISASCFFHIPSIYFSANRLHFILWTFIVGLELTSISIKIRGQGHHQQQLQPILNDQR